MGRIFAQKELKVSFMIIVCKITPLYIILIELYKVDPELFTFLLVSSLKAIGGNNIISVCAQIRFMVHSETGLFWTRSAQN